MTGLNLIRKRFVGLLILMLISIAAKATAAEEVVDQGRSRPLTLAKAGKSLEENPAFHPSSSRSSMADDVGYQDDTVVRSLLRQLNAASDEPLVYIPRAHVPTRSLWGQHYERPPYPRSSNFRPGSFWRLKNKEAGSEQKEVGPADGIVLNKRELRQRRLNSLRVAKHFPEINQNPLRVSSHYFAADENEAKGSKDEVHPTSTVEPTPNPTKVEIPIHTLAKTESSESAPALAKVEVGMHNEMHEDRWAETYRPEPTTSVTPTQTPPLPVKKVREARGYFSWPPSWWPFSCSTSPDEPPNQNDNLRAPPTQIAEPATVSMLMTPAQPPLARTLQGKSLRFVPIGEQIVPPTPSTAEVPPKAVTQTQLKFFRGESNEKPTETQVDKPVKAFGEQKQPEEMSPNSKDAASVMDRPSTRLESTTTATTTPNPTTQPTPESENVRFAPVNAKSVESPTKSLLTTGPGSQILIPVPIWFLPANNPQGNDKIPTNSAPESNFLSEPPTTTTTTTTPKPSESTTVTVTTTTTTQAPKSPTPIRYEVRFVPAHDPLGNGKQELPTTTPTTTTPKLTEPPMRTQAPNPPPTPIGYEIQFVEVPDQVPPPPNQIQPIDTPPRFRHDRIPRPGKIVINNFNPTFQRNTFPSGIRNAEKFRAGNRPPVQMQAQAQFLGRSNQDQEKLRAGTPKAPPPQAAPKGVGTSSKPTTTNGAPEVVRTLKDGSRVLSNGIVLPAGWKCPYSK